MRWWQQALLVSVALGGVERALAQAPIPELKFVEPPGFYRSAIWPPYDFSSTAVNASLQVYPFRVVSGDVRQAFARSLLVELIDPRFQETSVAPGPRFDSVMLPGADIVLRAHFRYGPGQVHERLRTVVVVGRAVAIVDVTASSTSAWEQVRPQINAFAASLQVGSGTAEPAVVAPPPPTSAGRAVAGLYMGFVSKYDAIQRQAIPALYYYLLSADGQVYRAYDGISVPGNDPARFDFAGARRADPVNSGRYHIEGDAIVMQLGTARPPERVVARLAPGNTLRIAGISYERQ